LRESGLFQDVVDATATEVKPLMSRRFACEARSRGSAVDRKRRATSPGFTARAARALRPDMSFAETPRLGQVVIATADRRVSGGVQWFGGDHEAILNESFDDMARDLAKFLVRSRRARPPARHRSSVAAHSGHEPNQFLALEKGRPMLRRYLCTMFLVAALAPDTAFAADIEELVRQAEQGGGRYHGRVGVAQGRLIRDHHDRTMVHVSRVVKGPATAQIVVTTPGGVVAANNVGHDRARHAAVRSQ
jgi:hypothetical protein